MSSEAAYPALPPPEATLLATMDRQGKRRWLLPKLSPGKWWHRRLIVAWILIALYAITPFLTWEGMPVAQMDFPHRRFVLFGTVFGPTDTLLFAVFTLAVFVGIFLLTAILGRVWCGWACPETVYLEFVFRPLDRLLLREGHVGGARSGAWRPLLLGVAYLLVSAHLANTFLAWFVGARELNGWIFASPADHPVAFTTFLVVTLGMLFQFGFWREQLCSLACPYGRFQSALLDRRSLVVGYDAGRGEPRGRRGGGQCVDCHLCVKTCPAGIDIRNGLQMECVQCTQCIDACDKVMRTLHQPTGLIRYGTQEAFAGGAPARALRARLVVYPALLLVLLTALGVGLATRTPLVLSQLRVQGQPFVLEPGGIVRGLARVRVENRTTKPLRLSLLSEPPGVLVGDPSVEVPALGVVEVDCTTKAPSASFSGGRRTIEFTVGDGADIEQRVPISLLGPISLPAEEGGAG